jgi:hypothetical protein
MAHYHTILVLASLVSVTWASPIQETIDSPNDLQKIGAKVSVVPSGQGGKATSYTFNIRWKAKVNGDPFGPRLDLLVGDDGKSPEPRLQVRYSQNAKGVFKADFTVSRIELGAARIAFRESQQTHYFLDLKFLVDGFPERDLRDPFHEDTKAEHAGADQPATKPADKVPSNDQPSTPTPKDGPR